PGAPTWTHCADVKPRKSDEPMSPTSFPRSAMPTHSYGIPIGGRKCMIVSAISAHESREPPGVAWSFPNGSMSTRQTFHRAGHSSRQFSLPFSIEDLPLCPHRSHWYDADMPSIPVVVAPMVPHFSQKASNGIHPGGYGCPVR